MLAARSNPVLLKWLRSNHGTSPWKSTGISTREIFSMNPPLFFQLFHEQVNLQEREMRYRMQADHVSGSSPLLLPLCESSQDKLFCFGMGDRALNVFPQYDDLLFQGGNFSEQY